MYLMRMVLEAPRRRERERETREQRDTAKCLRGVGRIDMLILHAQLQWPVLDYPGN